MDYPKVVNKQEKASLSNLPRPEAKLTSVRE